MKTTLVSWKSRNGHINHAKLTATEAAARLAHLDELEANTKRCAPTDSGDTRFNYCAEADAIRAAFPQPKPVAHVEPVAAAVVKSAGEKALTELIQQAGVQIEQQVANYRASALRRKDAELAFKTGSFIGVREVTENHLRIYQMQMDRAAGALDVLANLFPKHPAFLETKWIH